MPSPTGHSSGPCALLPALLPGLRLALSHLGLRVLGCEVKNNKRGVDWTASTWKQCPLQ